MNFARNTEGSRRVEVAVDELPPAPTLPTRRAAAWWRAKVTVHQLRRLVADLGPAGPRTCERSATLRDAPILASSRTPLWSTDPGAEWVLEAGKVENLRRAVAGFDGIEVGPRQVLGFWAQVGPPWALRGFVEGREVRQGCIIPSIAGGLCQLSNALFDVADRAGVEIVERHRHSRVVPGSAAEAGRDATVMWNYIDLRLRSETAFRVEATLEADALVVRLRGYGARTVVTPPASPVERTPLHVVGETTGVRSCLSCAQPCHRVRPAPSVRHGTRAWLLDGVWPEHDAWLERERDRSDLLLLPLDGRRLRQPRYAWSSQGFAAVHAFPLVAMRRAITSRRLARQGAQRQQALRRFDAQLADAMANTLPASATQLVIAQTLLPHLWQRGVLGGRRFDVLMTRPPLAQLHAQLDRARALHPDSPTLGDFRADSRWMDAEREALAAADRVITPHAAIAERFGDRAVRLGWDRPPSLPRQQRSDSGLPRVLFPASTLGRRGAYELRDALAGLPVELVLGGPVLEAEGFWDCPTRRGGLDDADLVVSPSHVEAAPRRLLSALARGLEVIASDASGLDPEPHLTIVAAGDAVGLRAAICERLGLDPAVHSVA